MSTELATLVDDAAAGRIKTLDFVKAIGGLEGVESGVMSALYDAHAARNWQLLQMLVLTCSSKPSPIYTEPLCKILEEGCEEMTNEDIVDVLFELQDERAIRALEVAAAFDFDTDEFHNLNLKCVQALANIPAMPAKEALNRIASSGTHDDVSAAATDALAAMSI